MNLVFFVTLVHIVVRYSTINTAKITNENYPVPCYEQQLKKWRGSRPKRCERRAVHYTNMTFLTKC